ncbi:MAG TPA: enoyl-CoA hydratase/isomerase family protein [Polyangia bacterium]|nr:enoyl-CoA hydratase/isomerase family protein [Polyangia bacterium]
MTYREIRVEISGDAGEIGELILARPHARNAMSDTMGAEIERAVGELNVLPQLRAVLVRGEGEAFSAGGDFAMLGERARDTPAANRSAMRRFYTGFLSVRALRVPTIAVIAGPAIGAGLCLALACDLRLAAADAKLAASFVRVGLHPGMGATYFLPRLIGPAAAADLLLTGRNIDAYEALRLGLVNQVHPTDALAAAARALAAQIASASPMAVVQTKATLEGALDRDLDGALEREAEAQAANFASEDLNEALEAISERRPPRFRRD